MLTFIKKRDKIAVHTNEESITYEQLIRNIRIFAQSFSLAKGDRAVIFSENKPEWIFALYSIWLKQGIAIPLDYTLSRKELIDIFIDSKPSLFLCSRAEENNLKEVLSELYYSPEVIILEDIPIIEYGVSCDDIVIENSLETALIMYTSGTSGRPKGVMLSYENIMTSIKGIFDLGMIAEKDRMIALLPFYHIFPLQGSVTAPFFCGVTICFVRSLQTDEILRVLKKNRITMFLGVPRLYDLFHLAIMRKIEKSMFLQFMLSLLKKTGLRLPGRIIFFMLHQKFGGCVHSYLTGGASMDLNVLKNLWALGFRLVEGYGATEAGPLISFNPFRKIKPGSAGKPMPGTEVKVVGDEILVKGKNIMQGYYNNPEETCRVIKNGWFHTGDRGYFDSDGYLYVAGRMDEIIVFSNGKKLDPGSAEKSLIETSSSILIKEAGVLLIGDKLTAVINPDFNSFNTDDPDEIDRLIKLEVIDKYNSTVADYRKIKNFKVVKTDLPRTRLGKLKRYLLVNMVISALSENEHEEEPCFKEYKLITEYLRGLKKIDVYADSRFDFDLALDSLDLVEFLSYIEMAFGVTIKPENLTNYSTPHSLASFIRMSKTRLVEEDVDWKRMLVSENNQTVSRRRLGARFSHLALDRGFSRYFGLTAYGLDNIPEEPFIIAPNHQSYIDVPLIGSVLPLEVVRNTFFIVKQSRIMSKFVSLYTLKRNIIIVDAENNVRDSMQKAAAVLLAGKNIMIFPEGIRTRNGIIQPFKKAFAILSSVLSVPVIPVLISGAYESMPYGSVVPKKGNVRIDFAPPVYPVNKDIDSIVDETLSLIKSMMNYRN